MGIMLLKCISKPYLSKKNGVIYNLTHNIVIGIGNTETNIKKLTKCFPEYHRIDNIHFLLLLYSN